MKLSNLQHYMVYLNFQQAFFLSMQLIKKLPKVNCGLAAQLHDKEEEENYDKENADDIDTNTKKEKEKQGINL